MIGVTAATADYYLHGCDRDENDHDLPGGPAEYYAAAMAAGEPAGVWLHVGDVPLDLPAALDPDDFRTLVDEWRDPWTLADTDKTGKPQGARLGKAPVRPRTLDQRVAEWERRHPKATPEQAAEARTRLAKEKHNAVHAWDITFSVPKSWSVLHAALEAAGRHEEAEKVWAAVQVGIETAMSVVLRDHAWTRVGGSGPEVNGRATTRHERVGGLVAAMFRHHVSRDQDPQLHAHVMVLNRVRAADGGWRAIDSRAITKEKHGLDAIFTRVMENELTRTMGHHFAARPDGVAREIVGVPAAVRDALSTRKRAVSAATQGLVEEYREKYGRAPKGWVLQKLNQQATLQSRRRKEHLTRAEVLARAEAKIAQDIETGLAGVVEETDDVRLDEPDVPLFDPVLVIEQALAHLDMTKTSWQRSHLMKAISDRLPDHLSADRPAEVVELLDELSDAALASKHVVALAAPVLHPLPPSMVDPRTGESLFDAPSHRRYATDAQLKREDSLLARTDEAGGYATTPERADALLAPFGLGEQQAAAARTVATSSKRVHVIDAAAGVGKSVTMGALASLYDQEFGLPLVGFATSQNAAQVLAGEGVPKAFNIARYLHYRDREDRGEVSERERVEFAIPAGAAVAIDESSTTSTGHLVRLLERLDEVGVGKVLIIGDTQQVDSVDQAGSFALLAQHADPLPIEQVRRFENAWERDASVRVRAGDVTAVTEYETRGRLHGSTDRDDLRAQVVRNTVTDLLFGRDAIAVTVTGEEARTLSSMIREQLIAVGHVDATTSVALAGETAAAVGDIVQARHNDWTPSDGPVINRETFRIVGVGDDGHVDVQRNDGRDELGAVRWGPVRPLAPEYVAAHLELGYAGTVDAVQGRTVDDSHSLTDPTIGRGRAYSAGTRGRLSNHLYLEIEDKQTPTEAFVKIVGTDDHERSARAILAAELDRDESLGHLGVLLQALTVDRVAVDHARVLEDTLGDQAAAVLADEARHGLLRQMRAAEAEGHDPRGVLADALGEGPLEGTRSPARALHSRIEGHLATRAPEREAARSWSERAPQGDDVESEYARYTAKRMDERVVELGMRTGSAGPDAPAWATGRLGAAPDRELDEAGFWSWVGNVADAAGFRERYGWDDPHDAIGPQPSRAEPEKRWAWTRAADKLGVDPKERELTAASAGELANRQQAWDREQTWMPPHVGPRLHTASVARDELRAQVVDASVAGRDTTVLEVRAAQQQTRVDRLEEVAAARAAAMDETRDVRAAAEAAAAEEARRTDRGLTAPATADETPAAAEPASAHVPDEPEATEAPEPAAVDDPSPAVEVPAADAPDEDAQILADLDQARAALDLVAERSAARHAAADEPTTPAVSEPAYAAEPFDA